MEGILSKADAGWSLSGWNEKYFVLTQNALTMFKKKNAPNGKPEWQIDLKDISNIQYSPPAAFGEGILWASKQYFEFQEKNSKTKKVHNFYASDKSTAKQWVQILHTFTNQPAEKKEPKKNDNSVQDDLFKNEQLDLRASQIQHMDDFAQNNKPLENLKSNLPKTPVGRKLPTKKSKALKKGNDSNNSTDNSNVEEPKNIENSQGVLVDDVSFDQSNDPKQNNNNNDSSKKEEEEEVYEKPLPPKPQEKKKKDHNGPKKPITNSSKTTPPQKELSIHQKELPIPQKDKTTPPQKELPIHQKDLPTPQTDNATPPQKELPIPQKDMNKSPKIQNENIPKNNPILKPTYPIPDLKPSLKKSLKPTYPIPNLKQTN